MVYCLCCLDEMGLGKTITMMGLFVYNNASHMDRIPSRQRQSPSLSHHLSINDDNV